MEIVEEMTQELLKQNRYLMVNSEDGMNLAILQRFHKEYREIVARQRGEKMKLKSFMDND